MSEWICPKCQHEVVADERPQPIKWTDGHRCTFRKFEPAQALPIVKLGSVEYFHDERLKEYRNVNDPHDVVKIDNTRRGKMIDVAKEMVDWFRSTDVELFMDEYGDDCPSMTYTGEELASLAGDYLSSEGMKFYGSLTTAERKEVQELAFDEDIYGY